MRSPTAMALNPQVLQQAQLARPDHAGFTQLAADEARVPVVSAQVQRRQCLRALCLGALTASLAGPVMAQTAAQTRRNPALEVPNSLLRNRDGREVRLVSDVWRRQVALVNFVFTTCSSFCSVQSAVLAELQQRLGARMGREVVFISLTLDPLNDDPARLQTYAEKFDAGPHWWWLTGQPRNVFQTLTALGADTGEPGNHAPRWLVGTVAAARVLPGLPSAAALEQWIGRAGAPA